MDEAEAFARDRRRYRLHGATFLVGIGGWVVTMAASSFLLPVARVGASIVFAVVFTISGVLAISVKRTIFSKLVSESDTDSDGDALVTPGIHTGDLSPFVANAIAPYAVLASGLGMLVMSVLLARVG